ncbi:MAG TPA: nicotinamide-nucleotide amidohydrolase family protein [Methylophilaceae bacterium]|nr:nicotinamide-nucleotide amidohydrolase family protein [Methylophilaceae bacterium]
MVNDPLLALAEELGSLLKARGWMLALAESCTGGWVAQTVTSIAGSSVWFDRGFVTYSNASKIEMLGVRESTLAQDGAVSSETATEMALGAIANSHAHIAVAITGIAGPDGGSVDKPVGMVCFAWAKLNMPVMTSTEYFTGDRQQIREQAVRAALLGLLKHTA